MSESIWNLESLKAYVDTRFASEAVAQQLSAKELQRRLETLNHAHEEAIRVQHTYVTDEKYEALHTALERRLNMLENWRSKAMGAAAVLSLISGAIGAAIVKVFIH